MKNALGVIFSVVSTVLASKLVKKAIRDLLQSLGGFFFRCQLNRIFACPLWLRARQPHTRTHAHMHASARSCCGFWQTDRSHVRCITVAMLWDSISSHVHILHHRRPLSTLLHCGITSTCVCVCVSTDGGPGTPGHHDRIHQTGLAPFPASLLHPGGQQGDGAEAGGALLGLQLLRRRQL